MKKNSSIKKENKVYVIPLKICTKFEKSELAIAYKYSHQDKKFLHNIKLDINDTTNLEELYSSLIKSDFLFLNPKFVSKNQVS